MGIRFSANFDFFSKWSSDMAYVLGFFCADGAMIDDRVSRGKYVRFHNTDLELLKKIRDTLNSVHNIHVAKSGYGSNKTVYVLKIGSKKMFADLIKKGMIQNKSLHMGLPTVPHKFLNAFVRGYLDGDGCIHIEKARNILRLIFTSGCKRFLESLSRKASAFYSVTQRPIYTSRRSFQLRYSQREAITILKKVYSDLETGLYLGRKRRLFEGFMKQREST